MQSDLMNTVEAAEQYTANIRRWVQGGKQIDVDTAAEALERIKAARAALNRLAADLDEMTGAEIGAPDPTRTINSIARTHFHQLRDRADPLTARNSDSLDFIDTAVWAIRAALEEAHMCGWADAEAHHDVADAYGAGMSAARQGRPHTTNPQ